MFIYFLSNGPTLYMYLKSKAERFRVCFFQHDADVNRLKRLLVMRSVGAGGRRWKAAGDILQQHCDGCLLEDDVHKDNCPSGPLVHRALALMTNFSATDVSFKERKHKYTNTGY